MHPQLRADEFLDQPGGSDNGTAAQEFPEEDGGSESSAEADSVAGLGCESLDEEGVRKDEERLDSPDRTEEQVDDRWTEFGPQQDRLEQPSQTVAALASASSDEDEGSGLVDEHAVEASGTEDVLEPDEPGEDDSLRKLRQRIGSSPQTQEAAGNRLKDFLRRPSR